jgi:hypothetical protein
MCGQRHAPAALPLGKTRYPLNRRLGGPQGRSGRVRNLSLPPPPPGIDPRTAWKIIGLHKLPHDQSTCEQMSCSDNREGVRLSTGDTKNTSRDTIRGG